MKTVFLNRALALILVAVLVIGMLPLSALAADDFYSFVDGVLTITSDMPSYDDPDTAPWHSYRDQITKVVVQGDFVWFVGNNAFAGCENLEQVVIDCESINGIGDGAFRGCTALTDVDFGDAMTSIRPYAFADCTALKNITIPTNIRYIGYGAFQGCSNLEDIYIYSRDVEYAEECIDEENYIYSNAATIPETTEIHCYPFGNAYYFCTRNERPYTLLTDGYAVSAENGDSTYDIGYNNEYVTNLWASAKVENGSADSICFDYDVNIDADVLCTSHDGMVDASNQKLFEGNNTSGELEVEVVFCVAGPTTSNSMRWYATYRFEPNDMEGNANEDYKNWVGRGNEPFVTFGSTGKDLTIHVEGSFAEMNARLLEIAGEEYDPEYAYISIYCRGISHYRGSNGREYDRKTTYIEGMSVGFTDVHNRNAECEPLGVITMTTPFIVTDSAPEDNAGYWEPAEKNYTWNYRVTRYGAYLDELGRMLGDIQDMDPDATEGTYLEEYDGITYGTVMGSYDAGSNPTACFRDILPQEHISFVESLAGLDAYGEYGQQVSIQLDCTLTLTYPDGTKILNVSVAHEGTSFAGVCVHACENCGLCTADMLLACNSDKYSGERILKCTCQEPAPALQISRVEASIGEAMLNIGDPKVIVEQVDLEESGDTRYLKKVFRMLSQEKTYAVFDISILDGEMPYTPNQWGGNYEYVDITIPVTREVMGSILSGDVGMYHIDADGNAETVDMKVDAENLTITVRCYQFSPYVLADTVSYYGRNALMAMENGEKYVYAYDQILFYINDNTYEEEVTIWVNDLEEGFTRDELAMVIDVFCRDHPELFWIADEYRVVIDGDDGLVYYFYLTMELMYEDRSNAINEVETVAEQILSGITEDMSDYEKELYIHDALAAHITYEETENAHDIYGALAEGKAVCDGYAEAFQYLLREAGIQSYVAVGTGNGDAHAWNYVRIDGKYYQVDLTWDDQGEELYHAYFNVTDTMMAEDHMTNATAYALPVCNSRDAFYFTGKPEELETYTVDSVSELFTTTGLKIQVYVSETDEFITWYQNNIGAIAAKVGITDSFTYGYSRLGHELILRIFANKPATYCAAVMEGAESVGSYETLSEAITVCEENQYVVLLDHVNENFTLTKDVYIDLNGCTLEGLTVTGKLYAFDSTATETTAGRGFAKVTGTVMKDHTANGKRYIALESDGVYTFHVLELNLTYVMLRTDAAGIYYKAAVTCDPVLQAAIGSYGVALSLNGMPGADFATDSGVSYTQVNGAPVIGEAFTSGSVFGIFKDGLRNNTARGEMKIYSNAYLQMADGTVLMSNAQEDAVGWSLLDVLTALDSTYAELETTQQTQAKDFCTKWLSAVSSWSLPNLLPTETE